MNTHNYLAIKKDLYNTIASLYGITEKELFQSVENQNLLEANKGNKKMLGIWNTAIALPLSGKLNKPSEKIAEEIGNVLNKIQNKQYSVTVQGSFINFNLSEEILWDDFKNFYIEQQEPRKPMDPEGQMMVEFGQPNTHKAFHAGHLKSAITGECLARLIERKEGRENVIRANYYGDIGMHVSKCTWGFIKKGEPKGFADWDPHKKMEYIDECYVYGAKQFKEDKNAESEIRNINDEIYAEKDTENTKIYGSLKKYSLEHQEKIWRLLNIVFDIEYPESTVYKKAKEIVNKYKNTIFVQSDGAWIFKGEEFGLHTWVFETKDGNPTYSAKDLGLAFKKFDDYPELKKSITTTSVEQKDYFRAVIKILELIDKNKFSEKYFHIPFGWMLREDGKKFSSRMGETVKGMGILNEIFIEAETRISAEKNYTDKEKKEIAQKVGLAGLKFLILSHKIEKDFSYNPDQFLSPKGFSGPYILYTYVRALAILKNYNEQPDTPIKINLGDLKGDAIKATPVEGELRNLLLTFTEKMDKYSYLLKPHGICSSLYELAQLFNEFYDSVPVLKESDQNLKNWRILLCLSVQHAIKEGLNLLGIDTVDKM